LRAAADSGTAEKAEAYSQSESSARSSPASHCGTDRVSLSRENALPTPTADDWRASGAIRSGWFAPDIWRGWRTRVARIGAGTTKRTVAYCN